MCIYIFPKTASTQLNRLCDPLVVKHWSTHSKQCGEKNLSALYHNNFNHPCCKCQTLKPEPITRK